MRSIQDAGNEVCLARRVGLAVGNVLRCETLLEGGVLLDEARIRSQRIAKSQLLTPARVAEQHHVQVSDTVALGNLDEESTPGAAIKLRWDVVPTGGSKSGSDTRYTVESVDCSLKVQDGFGRQVRHGRRSDVFDRCDKPRSEGGLKLQSFLLSALLPPLVRRANLNLLGRPRGPIAHRYIVPVVDPLAVRKVSL